MNVPPAESGLAAIAVACPRCHAAVAVPSALFGQAAACPVCSGGFFAPLPTPAQPPAAQQLSQPQAAVPQESPQQPSFAQVPQLGAAASPVPGLQPIPASEPPPLTVRRGNETIELRRLTPEEKAVRRIRRNIITIGAGTAILFAIVLVATQLEKKKPKRRK